jgi:DNA-binding GntR family transcriptional regulator
MNQAIKSANDTSEAVGIDAGGGADEDAIYEQIHVAVARQELPPGTRLREDHLKRIFGVSRARIRNVLTRLAYAGVVTMEPNRGASISRPSRKSAHDNFAARRAVEVVLVRNAAARFSVAHQETLARHIAAERQAERAGDMSAMVWLSGEFHVRIAEISENEILQRFLRELITREALVISTFERPGRPSCSHDEHKLILDALAARDAELVAHLMNEHLSNVEDRLDIDLQAKPAVDLTQLFAREVSTNAFGRGPK